MRIDKMVVCAGLAVAFLSACDKPIPTETITPVKVQTVDSMAAGTALSYSAQVTPETSVDMAFSADGYIVEIASRDGVGGKPRLIQPGDKVMPGEVLARIDDSKYRDQVTTAQANLDKAQAALIKGIEDWRRAQALNKTQSITGPDFDAAQQEFSTAQAAVSGAQAQLDEAHIKLGETALVVPQAAVINKRLVEIGTLVRPGSVGFELANTNTVKVIFGVPDLVLTEVKVGSALNVRVASMPDEVFQGTVTQIAPAADQRTRVFEVTVSVDNSDGDLREGMVAALDLPTNKQAGNIVMIPLDSIVRATDGGFAVYITENKAGTTTVKLTSIKTGEVVGNEVIVTSGLSSGDEVVIVGTAQISDGQTVKVLR
jgi:multidrug efflux system membrane fusion protein